MLVEIANRLRSERVSGISCQRSVATSEVICKDGSLATSEATVEENSRLGSVSQKSRNFSGQFRVPQFP